jgi:hypothetical protein
MPPSLRFSLDADAPAKLTISINRTDIAPGEPGDLQNYFDLKPGETITLPVYPRSLFSITECS